MYTGTMILAVAVGKPAVISYLACYSLSRKRYRESHSHSNLLSLPCEVAMTAGTTVRVARARHQLPIKDKRRRKRRVLADLHVTTVRHEEHKSVKTNRRLR